MEQAINAYRTITASPEFRELERLREKARHDEAQALYYAEQKGLQKGRLEGRQEGLQEGRQEGLQKGRFEIAQKMLKRNRPIHEIVEDTGLTIEEVEDLYKKIR